MYSTCLRRNRIAVVSCRVQLAMPTEPTPVYCEWLFGNDVITMVGSSVPASAGRPDKRRWFFGDESTSCIEATFNTAVHHHDATLAAVVDVNATNNFEVCLCSI